MLNILYILSEKNRHFLGEGWSNRSTPPPHITPITHLLLSSFLPFPKVEELSISAIYKSVILFFSVNLPMVFIYKFNLSPTPRKTSRTSYRLSSTRNVEFNMNLIPLITNQVLGQKSKLQLQFYFCLFRPALIDMAL